MTAYRVDLLTDDPEPVFQWMDALVPKACVVRAVAYKTVRGWQRKQALTTGKVAGDVHREGVGFFWQQDVTGFIGALQHCGEVLVRVSHRPGPVFGDVIVIAGLAKKIRWISEEDGDGAGYDILSFDEKGKERFLEVKTTVGSDTTPFYITRNELSLSSERPEAFRLCRVFDFSIRPRMFELAPPLADFVHLSPLSYEASFS